MFILVDKKTSEVSTVQGNHVRLSPDSYTVYVSWFAFYRWLFKRHCVICGESGNELHHIIPRSYGEDAITWRNQILLCRNCHESTHRHGIIKADIVKLQHLRSKVLRSYGREGFI